MGSSRDKDPLFGIGPNSPISVVNAARAGLAQPHNGLERRAFASLKEPTRPHTPSESARHLFTNGDGGSRPSSSYAIPNSRQFYEPGGPKLALPRLDLAGGRLDGTPRSSILAHAVNSGLGANAAVLGSFASLSLSSSTQNGGTATSVSTAGNLTGSSVADGTYGVGAARRSPSAERRLTGVSAGGCPGTFSGTAARGEGRLSPSQSQEYPAAGRRSNSFERAAAAAAAAAVAAASAATILAASSSGGGAAAGSAPLPTRLRRGTSATAGELHMGWPENAAAGSRAGRQSSRPAGEGSPASCVALAATVGQEPAVAKLSRRSTPGSNGASRTAEGDSSTRGTPLPGAGCPATPPGPSPPASGGSPALGLWGVPQPAPRLGPYRNDDLPPRPITSRGRPSTAGGPGSGELPEGGTITPYTGPAPTVHGGLGNGAEVLDMSLCQEYGSSDGEDAEAPDNPYLYYLAQVAANDVAAASAPATSTDPLLQPTYGSRAASPPPGMAAAAKLPAAVAIPNPVRQSVTPPLPPPSRPPRASAGYGGESSDVGTSGDWRSEVEEVLGVLGGCRAEDGLGVVIQSLGKLSGRVEEAKRQGVLKELLNQPCLTWQAAGATVRDAISEHVLRVIDVNSTEVGLKASRILLRVAKAHAPLLQTGRLLYSLSKDNRNDVLFCREGLLEPLLHTLQVMVHSAGRSRNPGRMHEPLMWITAGLKNVSANEDNQRQLVKLGALHVVAQLLTYLASQVDADGKSTAQVAVQASGLLRNLAVLPAHAQGFVASGLLAPIRAVADMLCSHTELVLNIARILSKLSVTEVCQNALELDGQYHSVLMKLLSLHSNHGNIVHRLTFTLGNLTTSNVAHRQAIARVPQALGIVTATLMHYTSCTDAGGDGCGGGSAAQPAGGAGGGGGGPALSSPAQARVREDCLVKLLRLVANLATQRELGEWLSAREEVSASALSLLSEFSLSDAEELVLNCVSALTNLSFYQLPSNRVLSLDPKLLLRHVTPLLGCPNDEAKVEAARLYGNLSRSPDVRACMAADPYVVRFLVALLASFNAEVLHSVVGTLINFTLDAGRKQQLLDLSVVGSLLHVLLRTLDEPGLSLAQDVALVAVVCKALFNICADDSDLEGPTSLAAMAAVDGCSFNDDEARELLVALDRAQSSEVGQSMEVLEVTERLADAVMKAKGICLDTAA